MKSKNKKEERESMAKDSTDAFLPDEKYTHFVN